MKQPSGQKSSAWFWVGVTLLSASALLWLILILGIAVDPEDIGGTVLGGVIFTAIPIGIGIYCVRRGRKAPAIEVQRGPEPVAKPVREAQQSVDLITESESKVVLKMPWWFRVVAWGELIVGAGFFIGYLPASLADPNSETLIPAGIGLFFILLGIWMVGITTKVTFNRPPGYMTVSRGHIPVFLWFLRTKRVSGEKARSVFVRSVHFQAGVGEYAITWTAYEVRVTTKSGADIKLYNAGWKQDKADYLAQRIREFGQQ